MTTSNALVVKVKKKIIEILTQIMNVQEDLRLTQLLNEYYKSDKELVKKPETAAPELVYLEDVLKGSLSPD